MKKKIQKRDEASARKEIYDNMSPEEILKKLDEKGLIAKKQRAKIQAILDKGKK